MAKNNPYIEARKRISFAYLLASNPETFEIIAKNNVNIFHGTNANALPNILKYGLKSGNELSKMGIPVSTGEEWSRVNGQRGRISFTDDLATALRYSSIQPSKSESKALSFGVLMGISPNDAQNLKTCHVLFTNLIEIGIVDDVPLEYIKVIVVPKRKVNFVRKLVDNLGIHVTSIDIDEKFYHSIGELLANYDPEKANELIKINKQTGIETIFNFDFVKKLAEGRKLAGIQGIYRKLQEKINNRGEKNGEDSKDK